MFTVTEAAQEQVALYFEGQEIKPIRLFLANGCGGQQLAMGVDEIKQNDAVYDFGEVVFVIEKPLLNQAQPIQIDFKENGFSINSQLPQTGGCSGCGSAGTCC